MSDFTIAVLMAALQATIAILPCVLSVLLMGRRRATASATIAAAAIIVAAGVTLVGLAPLPQCWSWAPENVHVTLSAAAGSPVANEAVGHAPNWDLARLLAMLRPVPPVESLTAWSWRSLVAWAMAVAAMSSLAVWMIGLYAVARLRRMSRRTRDPNLHSILDELRTSLNWHGAIDVRVSSSIGSAATCGIRRPTILLADDWHTWSRDELRAVLAHELAHIARRDFAIGVWVRACVAINAFHPLVQWLARRLRFAQELAADHLAAAAVGGRDGYRRSLARLALKQDTAWLPAMARSFGSKRNILLRRLVMLNVTDGRPLSRALHAMLIGMVVAAGVTASALRSPAQAPAAAPAPTALPTFELGYLEDKCEAFLVARPGALLSRPDMKPVLDSLSASLGSVLTAIGLPANAIPLGDIEQVVGPVELKELSEAERKSMPNGERHSISLGVVFIRMNRDFDWAALLRSLPKAIPVTEKSPGEFELRAAFFGPNPMTIRVLDRRTIVGSSATAEEAAKRRSEIEQRFGAPLLHEVNQSGLAIVVDNDRSRWSETIRSNPKFQGAMTALGKPNHLALCLYWNDNVEASLVTDWDNPPSDPAGSKQTICAVLDKSLRSAKPTDDADRRMIALATELLKSVQIHQSGKLIKADMSTSMRWANLLDVMLHQSASVEAHEEKSKEKQ